MNTEFPSRNTYFPDLSMSTDFDHILPIYYTFDSFGTVIIKNMILQQGEVSVLCDVDKELV